MVGCGQRERVSALRRHHLRMTRPENWPQTGCRAGAVCLIAELVTGGMSRRMIGTRLRTGRWQRVLPGVVVTHSGPLTADQRRVAGLVFSGRAALLSHRSAATMLGLRVAEDGVEVTVPHGSSHRSHGFVVVHQSGRPPERRLVRGLPCVGVARTVVDVACGMTRRSDVRALVSDAVQRGLVTVDALHAEAEHAPRHAPLLLRRALAEVTVGARSAGEAEFVRLLQGSDLPMPAFNARVETLGGSFLIDALWREYGVGVEIDGAAWHLGALSWERDLRRQNLITGKGIVLLRFPVVRLRGDPAGVLAEVRAALSMRASS